MRFEQYSMPTGMFYPVFDNKFCEIVALVEVCTVLSAILVIIIITAIRSGSNIYQHKSMNKNCQSKRR